MFGFVLALVLVLSPATGSQALAGPVQFASFTTASGTPFSFTNNGASPALGSDANSGNFSFATVDSLATIDHVDNLTISGNTTIPVYTAVSIFDRPNNSPVTDTIVFNDQVTNQTMLTMTFMGDLTEQFGSSNASLGSSAGLNVLSYSSPLLPTFISLPANFQLTAPTEETTAVAASGTYLNSFTDVTGVGQFFTNPTSIVPAPASAVMLATGLSAVAVLSLWKTRRRRLALIPVTD